MRTLYIDFSGSSMKVSDSKVHRYRYDIGISDIGLDKGLLDVAQSKQEVVPVVKKVIEYILDHPDKYSVIADLIKRKIYTIFFKGNYLFIDDYEKMIHE
jgi:hypothetical protein